MTRNRLYLKSSSFKMALLFTALLSAVVLSLGYLIYDFGRQGLERESESALDLEINNILLILQLAENSDIVTTVEQRVDSSKGIHYLLTDIAGNYLAGDLQHAPAEVDRLVEGIIVFEVDQLGIDAPGERKLVAKIHTFQNGDQLLVARDMDEFFNRFARLRLLSILSIVCMMLVIAVSFLISIFVVSRINRMSDTALAIMKTGDLSRRLTIDSSWDDLSHLSRVLNEMLSRIEGLVEGVKQVSNDIAHDLRTPLTRLRNRLEKIQSGTASEEDIESAISEADHLLDTFSALLRISRLEVGQERSAFEPVCIADLIQDAADLYEPVMREVGSNLEVEVSGFKGEIHGDRNLLFQTIVNLLDNAIKHGGPSIDIKVTLAAEGNSHVRMELEDSGPGINDAEKARVFDRFYRCDRSRSKPGSGLGLSMVAAVVQLHKGRIELYGASLGGLGVRIFLPKSLPIITDS